MSYVSSAIERIFPLVFEFRKERTKEEADAIKRKAAVQPKKVVLKRDDSDDCDSEAEVVDGSDYESYD